MWLRTVSMLRCSSAAMSSVDFPRSSSPSTSVCLGVRCGCGTRGRRVLDVRHLAEDADHPIALHQRHRAELDTDPLAVGADHDDLRVRRAVRDRDVAGEDLPRAAGLLRCDDRSELPAAHVADQAACRLVQPADDARPVDHVARDVDRLEGRLDVPADRLQMRHARSFSDPDAPRLISLDEALRLPAAAHPEGMTGGDRVADCLQSSPVVHRRERCRRQRRFEEPRRRAR